MTEHIVKNIIIKGSPDEIYSLWEDFESFPKFMRYIRSVRKIDEKRSLWSMRFCLALRLKWEARLTDLQKDRRIAWNSVSGDIKTSGQVTFLGLDHNETDVTVHMQYVPPLGYLGAVLVRWISNPDGKVMEDLKRFKKHAEQGHAMAKL
ncbi:MAG: SRPBCC family protein [Candidatus Omnitrophica bacterium]|nr:SRPBCC family protein [Candidatus Omnitrophota bacterium]